MKRPIWLVLALLMVVAVGGALIGWPWWGGPRQPPRPLEGLRDIASDRTIVVPTLDTPIPEEKNVVWSASFQLVWEEMKTQVTGGPVQLKDGGDAVTRLNDALSVAGLVEPSDRYATAGRIEDGIKDKIVLEMAERFPGVAAPELEEQKDGAVAIAYLRAGLRFTTPFPILDEPVKFTSADGTKTNVLGFGFSDKSRFGNTSARRQVRVLYSQFDPARDGNRFVLDLCCDTAPYQVLLASVPPYPTLEATLTEIEELTAKGAGFGKSLVEYHAGPAHAFPCPAPIRGTGGKADLERAVGAADPEAG